MANYSRQMPQSTKDKISAKMRGRKLTDMTKQKISNGVKKAWASVPQKTTTSSWNENNNEKNINY